MDPSVRKQKYVPHILDVHREWRSGTLRIFFSNRMLESKTRSLLFDDDKLATPAVGIYSCFATKLEHVFGSKFVAMPAEPPETLELDAVPISMWIIRKGGETLVANSSTVGACLETVDVNIDTSRVLFDPYTVEFFRESPMMSLVRDEKTPQLIAAIMCESDEDYTQERLDRMKDIVRKFNGAIPSDVED